VTLSGFSSVAEEWNGQVWVGLVEKISGVLIIDHNEGEMMIMEISTVLGEIVNHSLGKCRVVVKDSD